MKPLQPSPSRLRRGAEVGFRIVEDMLKAPIEPIVNAVSSGVSALWTGHVEKDKLELETIKGQLDAAKGREFLRGFEARR
jgi:hypothetical protein